MSTPRDDDFPEERAATIERERGTWREALRARYPIWASGLVRGFEVGDGWQAIVEKLCSTLVSRLGGEAAYPSLRLTQLKQKFGVIRIYFDHVEAGASKVVEQAILTAVERSRTTCEVCGEEGKLVVSRRNSHVACVAHEHVDASY